MAVYFDAKGTTQTSFQIQKGGARIANNSGNIDIKNAANSALVNLNALALIAGSATQVGTLIAYGDANKVSFQYKAGEAVDTLYIWPKDGTAGQMLSTDGSGNLTWVTGASVPTDIVRVASKTIGFGSGASVNHKLIPINAIVVRTEVIIDTPFDTAATIEVGITGTQDKYMGISENDLQGVALDKFVAEKGNPAVGAAEQIKVFFSAAAATVGSARVLVHYLVPEAV